MTNTPESAPVLGTSAAPLNLTPGATPSPVQGAALEAAGAAWTGKLVVGPHTFDLVSRLSALDMVILQEAQDSGQFRQIIEAVPRLVQKAQQQALKDYLLSDPEDENERVTLDDVLQALQNGLEQLAARPTDR